MPYIDELDDANHGKRKGKAVRTPELLRRQRDPHKAVAEWGNAKPDLLARAVTLVTAAGDAVMLGITQDGGALVFNIYHNGERHSEYIGARDDTDEFLEGVIRDYES
jgi:hypothetical protein